MKRILLLITPLAIFLAACTKNESNNATPATEDTATTEKPKVKPPPDEMGSEVYLFTDSSYLESNPDAELIDKQTSISTRETVELNKTKDQIIIRGQVLSREPNRSKWSVAGRQGITDDYYYSEVTKEDKVVRYYATITSGETKIEIRLKGEILE